MEETALVAVEDVPAAPLSRRAMRESLRAAAVVVDAGAARAVTVDAPAVVDAPVTVDMPVIRVAPEAETPEVEAPAAEPSDVTADAETDAFAEAARAFQTAPVAPTIPRASAEEHPAQKLPTAATAVHVAPRKGRASRRFAAVGATIGIMGVAGLLAVSMTLPAEAIAAAQGGQSQTALSLVAASLGKSASAVTDDEIQAYVASSGVQNETIQRSESFSTASLIDLATAQGINYSNTLYTNDPEAAIQWPFIVGVAMSSGYGMRDTGMHEGIDLVPGAGAPTQAIADGTVRIATEAGGNYGVTVYIDHIIDGQLITSHYSHMQYGSLEVSAGQTVKVGDIIGKVGNTGRSYGAHMHFELIVNGSTIDPLPWLQENAGRNDGVTPVS